LQFKKNVKKEAFSNKIKLKKKRSALTTIIPIEISKLDQMQDLIHKNAKKCQINVFKDTIIMMCQNSSKLGAKISNYFRWSLNMVINNIYFVFHLCVGTHMAVVCDHL